MQKENRSHLIVGAFLFIGLSVILLLVLQFGRIQEMLKGSYSIIVIFKDGSGLIEGSEVRLGGSKVGKVSANPLLNNTLEVEVPISLYQDVQIPKNATFAISSTNIMGDKKIDITIPEPASKDVIMPNSRIVGGGLSGLDAITEKAENLSNDATALIKKTEESIHKIDTAVEALVSMSKDLQITLKKVNEGLLKDENLNALEVTLHNFKETSSALKPAIAKAEKSFTSIQELSDELKIMAKKMNPTLEKAPLVMDSFQDFIIHTKSSLNNIQQGKGMVGVALHDQEAAADLKTFVKNLKTKGILRYQDTKVPVDDEDPRYRYRGSRR